jgi:hypothetical protein
MKEQERIRKQEPSPSASSSEWQKPELETLGSFVEATAGPSGGTLDLLIGSDGGFQDVS